MRLHCAADAARGCAATPLREEPLRLARDRYSGGGRVLNFFRCFLGVLLGIV